MAQPSIPGIAVGIPRMVYGNDGTNWIAVLVDALGHIQADILSSVLPTDAAKETKQDTMITALQLIDDLRNALGSVNTDDLQVDVKTSALPTDAATQTTLASCLTALQLIDDLRNALGSVNTDDLQVDVKTSALPTDAATQTTLASCLTALQLIDDLRNALGSVNTDDLQVDVKTSALPTDAATQTTLAACLTALQLIDDLRNALGSVNTDDLQVDVKTTVPPIPASPIVSWNASNVSPSTWTDLLIYTVTAGKTLYLYYWSASPSANVAGFAFITRLTIDDSVKDHAHAPAGGGIHIGFPSPIKATAGQVVAVEGYHAEAGAEWLAASIVGFEV